MRVRKLNESVNDTEVTEGIFNIGAAKKLNTILQDCDNLKSDTVFGIWETLYDALNHDKAANDKIIGNIDYKKANKLYPDEAEWADSIRPFEYIADINNDTKTQEQQDFLEDIIFGVLRDIGDYLEETKNNKLAAQILKEFKDDFKKYQKWLDTDGEDSLEENAVVKKIRENKKESSNKDKYLKEKWSMKYSKEQGRDMSDIIMRMFKDGFLSYKSMPVVVADFVDAASAELTPEQIKDLMLKVGGDHIKNMILHDGTSGDYSTGSFFFGSGRRDYLYGIRHWLIDTFGSGRKLHDLDIDFLARFAVELQKRMSDKQFEFAVNHSASTMNLINDPEEYIEEGFLSKKAVKGEANKLTDFLTANAEKIKSLADCAPYILDDISDVTINTAVAKDSEEMDAMLDIANACAKEFGYPNFETLRADDDVEVHFEAAKYLSKFVDAKKLGYLIKEVKNEIADCEKFGEALLKEDIGEDVGEYQEWVDYDMKKYGHISKETFDKLKDADLTVVKDEYGDYEVIPHEKIHEACRRKTNKKLDESIIYTSEGLNNAMKEFAKVVRDWKKTHVDSQEEKVIAESNWDDDSFNTFIATLEG